MYGWLSLVFLGYAEQKREAQKRSWILYFTLTLHFALTFFSIGSHLTRPPYFSSAAALTSVGVHMSEPEPEIEPHSGWVLKEECRPQCILPSDPGYVLYSAIGSFFAPMMVMIFFNWRIYRQEYLAVSVK